jgi:transposase InsO family protein
MVLSDEKATTAIGFLRRALGFYAAHGVRVQRLMTDNGPAYTRCPTPSPAALGLRHLRTRRYRPRTDGKAERFIRTLLGGWAYGAIYASSPPTPSPSGLSTHNYRRPHGALSHHPPAARLTQLTGNNVSGSYSSGRGDDKRLT